MIQCKGSIPSFVASTTWCIAVAITSATGAMNAHADETSATTALTIYSTAQPGAISPDLYRPGGVANFGRSLYVKSSVSYDRRPETLLE